jgi:hypothetical protein
MRTMRRRFLLTAAVAALAFGVPAAAAPSTAPSFAAAKGYETGAGPRSAALGDVNGDGRQDLVTGNYYGGTVSVLLGNGDGTLQRYREYDVGTGPAAVAMADVNGDGKLDVATANLWAGTVAVLLNHGDGTFAAAVSYGAGRPFDIALRDVTGDSAPDLVFANDEAGAVSVLTNNGHGTFGSRRDYATGAGPDALEVGDLDADGRPDIATANGSSSTVSVLLNQGGTFQPARDYAAASGFPSLALGDVDADGKPDLVSAGYEGAFVLLNRGETFETRRALVGGTVELADLNGDGRPDLVGGAIAVNLGNGRFGQEVSYRSGEPIAVGDLNGDGRPDLVSGPNEDEYDPEEGEIYVRINSPGLCNVQNVEEHWPPLTLAGAKRILERGHCRVGKVKRAFHSYVKKGRVISQKPGYGAVLPPGGKVRLVISKGKRK